MRRAPSIAAAAVALALLGAGTARADEPLNQYVVTGTQAELDRLPGLGYDVTEGTLAPGRSGIVATPSQADGLRDRGFAVSSLGKENTQSVAPMAVQSIPLSDPSWGYDVWRPWNLKPAPCQTTCSGAVDAQGKPVSLKQWYDAQAAAHPELIKREVYGTSVNGQELVAYKVTADAQTTPDGAKPGAMYNALQHAREWISGEVVRREFQYVVEHPEIARDVELWFVPVMNPDGYDYTFQSRATRLWRKNLRDTNGDGVISSGDGIDTNRNFSEKWRYDNEGSSSTTSSETYRGPSPESESEVSSFHALMARIKPVFQIDYHSYAKLILYPVGWQVETWSPDTPIFEALAGNSNTPAVSGYDPEVGAQLYTTNGEITDTMYLQHGILATTVELDGGSGSPVGGTTTAGNAVGSNPGGFVFQDREADVQAVFQRNLQYALDQARSAAKPDEPVSQFGYTAADFVPSSFPISYGAPQTVEVDAKRSLGPVTVKWQIGSDPTVYSGTTSEFAGGSRYGAPGKYYHHMRGSVHGFGAGQTVKVWFSAGGKESAPFTFTASAQGRGNRVLVLSAEDYGGVSPNSAPMPGPSYLSYYLDALADAGIPADVYDIDANGRNHADALGVLDHYDAVIWYTGDDDYVRDPGQSLGVSKMYDDQMIAVRDYLNEGGKVLVTGQRALQGAWSGYSYNPLGRVPAFPQCTSNTSSGAPPGQAYFCVPTSNDFMQYWLGAYSRTNHATTKAAVTALSLTGPTGTLSLNGPDSADNASYIGRFGTTSATLPVAQYPQFESWVTHSIAGSSNTFGVATKDTLLWAFGLESVRGRAARAQVLADGLKTLGVTPYVRASGGASGTVPATLSLSLGPAASFGVFTPGVDKTYTAQTTANVISTAGDAALSVSDPGRLANGAFLLPEALQVTLSKSAWTGPVSNDSVAIGFSQHIGSQDGLRTGTYSKTLTFTLSTTTP